ncbi:MAP4K3-like protein hppy isoform X2 [Brevipalpus obovatus]|uniref:MAP4K3-like protein hppy isoform X2 n=1 Tax=Brevipalpus obovatus TaxID=246614 RepID=UPI003D9E2A52
MANYSTHSSSSPRTVEISHKSPTEDYQIIAQVGSGTYGNVYKAHRLSKSEMAAIKIIKLDPADDFALIQQEIIMMKECRHPNIVAFFGSYLRRDKLWICMEYCGGGSLQGLYSTIGRLPESHIAFVCRETLRGLAYLHSMGKMHRDIKGANILLTDEGDVKLADFGVSAEITATMNRRRSLIGSPYWIAPEVVAVEKKGGYDQQCDIWAVGITAIELAEKQPPMYDIHPMRVLYLLARSNFKPPTLADKSAWSHDFNNFIKLALTKNPKKRPLAEKLLSHSFLLGDHLRRHLMKELLEKARNPHLHEQHFHYDLDPDEEPALSDVPRRIPSKNPHSRKERTQSELRMESLNFGAPLLTELSPANENLVHPTNITSVWGLVSDDDGIHGESCRPFVQDPSEKKSLLEMVDEELMQRGHKSSLTALYSQSTLPVESLNKRSLDKENLLHEMCSDRDISHNNESEEFSTPPSTPKVSGSPPDSSSFLSSESCSASNPTAFSSSSPASSRITQNRRNSKEDVDGGSGPAGARPPSAPPRRRDRKHLMMKMDTTPANQISNGLPPTPKVHMGACFSKVFNECPLKIHCSASWVHPETRDQHILLGCEEGIYTLNLNQLHDACMDQLFPRKTTWMFVIKDVLMSLSGKTSHLYRHDLVQLHARNSHKFSPSVDSMINKIPDRFVPWKMTASSKVSDTKGCTRCCVGRNPYNGYKYLCGVTQNGIFLMQWYNPLNKFMQLKQFELYIPPNPDVFTMIITPDLEYPMLCIGVKRGYDQNHLRLDIVNLNSSSQWFSDDFNDGTETVVSKYDRINTVDVIQLDKDTILVCHDRSVKLVNLEGKLKSSRKQPAELKFSFDITSIVCLADCVLAFNKHGVQGRSFKNDEVVQEITDESRCFRLLGADRIIALESRPTLEQINSSNLYILAGHENSY